MVVAEALATHKGIGGAMVFAARFLATNARMVVAVAVALATHAGIDGAMLFAAKFLAPKTPHTCNRG